MRPLGEEYERSVEKWLRADVEERQLILAVSKFERAQFLARARSCRPLEGFRLSGCGRADTALGALYAATHVASHGKIPEELSFPSFDEVCVCLRDVLEACEGGVFVKSGEPSVEFVARMRKVLRLPPAVEGGAS